jgi:hypothetical protein
MGLTSKCNRFSEMIRKSFLKGETLGSDASRKQNKAYFHGLEGR